MTSIQGVFNQFFDEYRSSFKLSIEQYKVANAIMNCRTSKMGGHVNKCDSCNHMSIAYNSCRNRHCPLCQSVKREKWRVDRNADLLNTHYFHMVFTVPEELNPIIINNQEIMYALLMKSAAKTLKDLSLDEKHLGAEIGLTGILHTWGQTLSYHPHVHFIVPGGGLCPKTKLFKKTRENFYIHVNILSSVFRGIFLKELEELYNDHQLIHWSEEGPKDSPVFKDLIDLAYKKDFVVHSKPNFDSPAHVIKYLCQYTHRVAISNHRIIKVTDQEVTFRYKDNKDGGKSKVMTLKGTEFIRRYFMHVLPSGFVKIRHYGMFAGRNRPTKLAHCQRIMGIIPSKKSKEYGTLEFMKLFIGFEPNKCPKCDLNTMERFKTFDSPLANTS